MPCVRPLLRAAPVLAALAALALAASAAAKTPEEVRAACRAEHRPCVGLVLSGGGARGFAHVGVIRVLEELGVKVDVVAGTSMGSMVGGAYAAGFTLEELERTVLEVDWDRMLSPRPERRLVSWRKKEDDYKSLPSSGVEISRDGTPMLPAAFVPSEELELFLARKTAPVEMVRDLSMLPVPFAAPATDLVTGRRVVMQKGCSLREAMRASMSVPGAFSPAQWRGDLLVDGGLVDNLPVELAREMGADVVVAVNVGTPLSGRDKLGNVVGVMAQMVNLLTEQNVQRSIAALREDDLLITPDLKDLSSADLKKSREIIALGEAAARRMAGRLKRFARPQAEWTAWNDARTQTYAQNAPHRTRVAAVRVEQHPGDRVPVERILEGAAVRLGSFRSRRELDAAARSVFAEGYFESVTYRLDPGPDGTASVVFEPREKDSNWSSVRFGGSLETDFNSVSTFNVLFAHTWHLMNAWGAEWRNEVQVGESQRFLTEFYQPLGRTMPFFVEPSVSYSREDYDAYVGRTAAARWRNAIFEAKVLFGWEFARLGYAGVSAGYLASRTRQQIGLKEPPWHDKEAPYGGVELFLDTLDSVSFPTKGWRLTATGKFTNMEPDVEGDSYVLELNALVPWSVGRWTALAEAELQHATVTGMFKLGGASRMVGAPYGRWAGSRLEYGRVQLSRNISDWVPVEAPVWAGVQGELGRAWNDAEAGATNDGADRSWQKSLSFYVGVDSLIGPIIFTIGRTAGEGTGVYFRWGYRQ